MHNRYELLGRLVERWNEYDPSTNDNPEISVFDIDMNYAEEDVLFAVQQINGLVDQYTMFNYKKGEGKFSIIVKLWL